MNYSKTSSNSNVSSLYLLIPVNSRVLKFYDNDKTVPIFYRISPISETIIILHKPAYPWYCRTTDKLVVCLALKDENEEIRHHAADSLFGFYLRKKNYTMAEKNVEGTYKVVEKLLENVDSLYDFQKSKLY